MNKQKKIISLIPAIWASSFDIVITIIHQSKEYWNGNLSVANEGNPIGAFFMKNHISGIFLISALWLITIGLLGYYLPKKLAKVFLLFILLVHSWGASGWLYQYYSFWCVLLFMLINSVLFWKIEDYCQNTNSANAK